MNGKPYRVAFIQVKSVNRLKPSWLIGGGKPFWRMEALDFDRDFLETVYKIYKDAYSKFDRNLFLKKPDSLLDYLKWVVFIDEKDHVVAFFICKEKKPHGVKMILTAAVDSREAKDALIMFNRKAFNSDGVYAEISPPLEKALIGHVPEIEARVAQQVLGYRKKIISIDIDKKHYTRHIRNVGNKVKIMVGKPF